MDIIIHQIWGSLGVPHFQTNPSNPWIADLRGTPQASPRRCPASTIEISPMDTKNSGNLT